MLFDMASSLSLQQRSNIINELGFQLDLVPYIPCTVSRSHDPFVAKDTHHPALEVDLSTPKSPSVSPRPIFTLNYYKCDLVQVRADIADLNCAIEYKNEDTFYKYITELSNLIKRSSPLRRVGRSPFPRWFSGELKSMIINKKTLHRIYKTTGLDSDYMVFARARTACKALAVGCYNSYISHVNRTVSSNPKVFWSYIKNLRRNDTTTSRITLADEV